MQFNKTAKGWKYVWVDVTLSDTPKQCFPWWTFVCKEWAEWTSKRTWVPHCLSIKLAPRTTYYARGEVIVDSMPVNYKAISHGYTIWRCLSCDKKMVWLFFGYVSRTVSSDGGVRTPCLGRAPVRQLYPTSASFLAETLVKSPRKLFIFII